MKSILIWSQMKLHNKIQNTQNKIAQGNVQRVAQ